MIWHYGGTYGRSWWNWLRIRWHGELWYSPKGLFPRTLASLSNAVLQSLPVPIMSYVKTLYRNCINWRAGVLEYTDMVNATHEVSRPVFDIHCLNVHTVMYPLKCQHPLLRCNWPHYDTSFDTKEKDDCRSFSLFDMFFFLKAKLIVVIKQVEKITWWGTLQYV